jgi:hypothetical protein
MAVRMVRELANRHLSETQDGQVIGIISLSNLCGMIPALSHTRSLVVIET